MTVDTIFLRIFFISFLSKVCVSEFACANLARLRRKWKMQISSAGDGGGSSDDDDFRRVMWRDGSTRAK